MKGHTNISSFGRRSDGGLDGTNGFLCNNGISLPLPPSTNLSDENLGPLFQRTRPSARTIIVILLRGSGVRRPSVRTRAAYVTSLVTSATEKPGQPLRSSSRIRYAAATGAQAAALALVAGSPHSGSMASAVVHDVKRRARCRHPHKLRVTLGHPPQKRDGQCLRWRWC